MITRREFVAGVACCAVAGKLMGQEAGAGNNEYLVSPCGLYCGACSAYIATQRAKEQGTAAKPESGAKKPSMGNMQCDGCLGGGRIAPHASSCAIKECAASKSKNRLCSDCPEFPCDRITDFNNDGIPHHGEVLENLRQLKAMGLTEWAKHEEDRWRCSKCRTMLSWYDAECPSCKNSRSDKLFPLRKA